MKQRLILCGVLMVATIAYATTGTLAANKPAPEKPDAAKLTEDEKEKLKTLFVEFREARYSGLRAGTFRKMLRVSPNGAPVVLKFIEREIAGCEEQYIALLENYLPHAYREHLTRLTDQQIYQVQWMRRLWKHYILTTTTQRDFQKVFLDPAMESGQTLFIKVDQVLDKEVANVRTLLQEHASYLKQCREAMGLGLDPTCDKVSPTNIPYPSLDDPPTFTTNLDYLERSLVLGYTVGPEGARRVLMMCAQAAKEMDTEESDFALMANEVRMLTGSIAWRLDPLMSACVRDHSADRKAGLASGHMSTVPGKHGFTDRLRRFGTSARSEGAGGGRSGRDYLRGLSYGGGHTGPLYGLKRNVVGVGRRGGVYTSVYRTENDLIHPCAAVLNELFMPPGLLKENITSETLKPVFDLLKNGEFGKAYAITSQSREKDAHNKMMLKFFQVYLQVEEDWFFEGITELENVGDAYEVHRQIDWAKQKFAGIRSFEKRLDALEKRLGKKKDHADVEAGKAYHEIAVISPKLPAYKKALAEYIEKHPGTEYAKAAKMVLETKEGEPGLFDYFLDKSDKLRWREYPQKI